MFTVRPELSPRVADAIHIAWLAHLAMMILAVPSRGKKQEYPAKIWFDTAIRQYNNMQVALVARKVGFCFSCDGRGELSTGALCT
jgi:hypothetical protein